MILSLEVQVNNPVLLTVAVAPLDTDQVPPATGCVYCEVLLPQMVAAPVISILAVELPTKLEVVPVLVKLVKVPIKAIFDLLLMVEMDVFVPPATPSLKSK